MRKVAQFLPYVSRGLAICAMLAGVGVGLLQATVVPGFVCFDFCPDRAGYLAQLGLDTVLTMTPCVVLEVLAMVAFVTYGLATRQPRRAVLALLVLLAGGLVGVAALAALLQHAQATIPSGEGSSLLEGPLAAWQSLWGWALTLVAGAWSGVLAYLQWRR